MLFYKLNVARLANPCESQRAVDVLGGSCGLLITVLPIMARVRVFPSGETSLPGTCRGGLSFLGLLQNCLRGDPLQHPHDLDGLPL